MLACVQPPLPYDVLGEGAAVHRIQNGEYEIACENSR